MTLLRGIDASTDCACRLSIVADKGPRYSYAAGMITAFTVSRRDTASSAF